MSAPDDPAVSLAAREAACSCGQLRLQALGEPIRTSICHCLACQRRTGSAFGIQAAYPADRVQVAGSHTDYARTSDEEDGKVHVFHFCPKCGGTVFYTESDEPDRIVIMAGAFADPSFPAPTYSSYESRRHPWVGLPADVERDDVWESLRPLYEAGDYAAVADRGRELIDAHPRYATLLYNVACCESMAGRTQDAIEHLSAAIELEDELRALAAGDSDLDPLRNHPAFDELIA